MYCIARVYGVYSVHNPDQSDATFDANVRVCADNGVDAFICTDANIITIMVTVTAKHSVKAEGFKFLVKYLFLKRFREDQIWCHVFVTNYESPRP